jgi:acyl carrier protein
MIEGVPAPAPRGEHDIQQVEARLLALWGAVLGREDIRTDQNFFELGGRSLHVMLVVNRLNEEFGIKISPMLFFDAPTIAEQAALFAGANEEFSV